MTDSVKDEVKVVCKPTLDHKNDDQVAVTNETPIIPSVKNIQKSFYEEVGEALEYLDKCDSQSDLSSVNSADIKEVENVFGHIFLRDDNISDSEEILQIN
jgi:hypothetical protein